jgi:hypothetical protein
VTYLTVADFSMREELVLKIAILAEKFAPNVEVRAKPHVRLPNLCAASSCLVCWHALAACCGLHLQ